MGELHQHWRLRAKLWKSLNRLGAAFVFLPRCFETPSVYTHQTEFSKGNLYLFRSPLSISNSIMIRSDSIDGVEGTRLKKVWTGMLGYPDFERLNGGEPANFGREVRSSAVVFRVRLRCLGDSIQTLLMDRGRGGPVRLLIPRRIRLDGFSVPAGFGCLPGGRFASSRRHILGSLVAA